MTDELTTLGVQIEPEPDADAEELAALALLLRRELLELDVEAVEQPRKAEVPEGTRAVDALFAGALLVKLAPEMLAIVLRAASSWLNRSRARTVEVTVGDKSIILAKASADDQERLIRLFEASVAGR
jgi:hypothetical protein